MFQYRLYSDGERSVIAESGDWLPLEFTPRSESVIAPSWLAAKVDLGFELTPIQSKLLEQQLKELV